MINRPCSQNRNFHTYFCDTFDANLQLLFVPDRMSISESEFSQPVITYKLVVLGDTGVGKSSIVLRYVKGLFNTHQDTTIGAAFLTKTLHLSDHKRRLEIWDTGGLSKCFVMNCFSFLHIFCKM